MGKRETSECGYPVLNGNRTAYKISRRALRVKECAIAEDLCMQVRRGPASKKTNAGPRIFMEVMRMMKPIEYDVITDTSLTVGARLIYFVIKTLVNSGVAPTYTAIQVASGVRSSDTISRAIKALHAGGYMVRTRTQGGNEYSFPVGKLYEAA